MNNEIVHRIHYYTRKVAERSSINRSEKLPRWSTSRHQRLMKYKKLLHDQINKSGFRFKN
jgi:hypothetical protein